MTRLLFAILMGLTGCQGALPARQAEAGASPATTPMASMPSPEPTPSSPTPESSGLEMVAPPPPEASCTPTQATSRVTFKTYSIPVDLAWTPESRQKGLSGRPCLAKDTGLVLGWDEPTPVRIWMPDMNFAIDVVFVRSNSVLAIYEDAQPCVPGENCFSFGPPELSNYVLEVPAGSVARWKLRVGDPITLIK
ncbi:MAG: DUF192 domain-containing protein [Candidatus Sericytochromatia bacterium]|nr:DUF192 domain-containing protein [Candidatus Sericytochromatia bacterium]